MIDVIIPSYNELARLDSAVRSVLNQTQFKDINKILILDDGSKSSVISGLSAITKLSNKIEIDQHSHRGNPGYLRKIGVKTSVAKYVAFLDADDEWEPQKIERQLKHLLEHQCKAICTNAKVRRDGLNLSYFEKNDYMLLNTRSLLKTNRVITSSLLIDREILQKVDFFCESESVIGAEDYATWLRVSTYINFCFLSQDLVSYSYSLNSLSRSMPANVHFQARKDFIQWLSKSEFSKISTFVICIRILRHNAFDFFMKFFRYCKRILEI